MVTVYPITNTVGVSDLRTRQKEVLSQLSEGPIVLAQHNRPLAVLVDVDLWNRLIEELTELQDAQISMERLAQASSDVSSVQSLDDVEDELRAEGLLNA